MVVLNLAPVEHAALAIRIDKEPIALDGAREESHPPLVPGAPAPQVAPMPVEGGAQKTPARPPPLPHRRSLRSSVDHVAAPLVLIIHAYGVDSNSEPGQIRRSQVKSPPFNPSNQVGGVVWQTSSLH